MKHLSQNKKTILTFAGAFVISVVVATSAWAALSLVDSSTVSQKSLSETVQRAELSKDTAAGRAPEPTTMALFGSGIFGMIVSFVRRTYRAVKRVFDIFISLTAVILLSPLFLFTALLIKLCSPRGSVIFKQIRVGKYGKPFEMYKFRTMKMDAEKESGPVWAKENDPRLILCGKFIRKAHIDEIPQFFNVLRGEMSFIGPRPERPVFVDKFKKEITDYEKRLAVKPGITGLAQVWHTYDETIADVRKKIKYDLLYIRKICLWTDLRIIFRTVRVVFTGEGAR